MDRRHAGGNRKRGERNYNFSRLELFSLKRAWEPARQSPRGRGAGEVPAFLPLSMENAEWKTEIRDRRLGRSSYEEGDIARDKVDDEAYE